MLTSMYYYDFYKPYILQRHLQPGIFGAYPRSVALKNTRFTKNNALRRNVLDYVENVCRNAVEMKDSARYLAHNSENYYVAALRESFETAKRWVEEDVTLFVRAFNAAVRFGLDQVHSPHLLHYAGNLKEIALDNVATLKDAGIYVDNDAYMRFDPDKIKEMDYERFTEMLSGTAKTAASVYDRTNTFLLLPAESHMNFRPLSYYYNYRVERVPQGSDSKYTVVLHCGLILDRVI